MLCGDGAGMVSRIVGGEVICFGDSAFFGVGELPLFLATQYCCFAIYLHTQYSGSVRDGEAKIVDSLSLPGKKVTEIMWIDLCFVEELTSMLFSKTVGSVDLADAQIQHSTTSFSANWNGV